MRLFVAATLGVSLLLADITCGNLLGIPTVSYSGSSTGVLSISAVDTVVVDSRYQGALDTRGATLIPPTLSEFATVFASDIKSTLGRVIQVRSGTKCAERCIFLTIGNPGDYKDAAGRETSEGYSLAVDTSAITITGASPLGVWWGTRTVLQQAILNNGSVPVGSGVDSPGWDIRGMMLDAGRHFYPKEFLMEMCSYMSFFKQNTFHVHLSDNLYANPHYTRQQTLDLYARFRLWSDSEAVAGLNRFKNESYTREDFEEIQHVCAARGVTVLPEIEAPGHALVIVQWKPQIGFTSDLSLLNITHPDTIPAMKAIWGTFLDWFHTKVVSIGADEYSGTANDYNKFVNEMASYIGQTSGKGIRIWGTFPPKPTYKNIYQNVSIQHWALFEDDPYFDYIKNNYSVVNSLDDFYVVTKWSGSYPQSIQYTKSFKGNPKGGPWYPHIFDLKNATRNPDRSNPFVLGSIVPLWNDWGPNSSVYSEVYYAWRKGLPALADKQWGGNLTEVDFNKAFAALQPFAPGENLERKIPTKSKSIFNYTLDGPESGSVGTVKDSSPNGYDAKSDCRVSANHTLEITPSCSLVMPFGSKGRDYSLAMSVMVTQLDSQTNVTLLFGTDSNLMLTPKLTLFAGGNYYRLNVTVPLDEWAEVTISGQGNKTFGAVSTAGKAATKEEFRTKMGINGDGFRMAEMAIEAPIKQLGGTNCGWVGQLRSLGLTQ